MAIQRQCSIRPKNRSILLRPAQRLRPTPFQANRLFLRETASGRIERKANYQSIVGRLLSWKDTPQFQIYPVLDIHRPQRNISFLFQLNEPFETGSFLQLKGAIPNKGDCRYVVVPPRISGKVLRRKFFKEGFPTSDYPLYLRCALQKFCAVDEMGSFSQCQFCSPNLACNTISRTTQTQGKWLATGHFSSYHQPQPRKSPDQSTSSRTPSWISPNTSMPSPNRSPTAVGVRDDQFGIFRGGIQNCPVARESG